MLAPPVKERLPLTTLASPPVSAQDHHAGCDTNSRWTGWGFVGPFMLVFALVFLAPIAYSL